VRLGLRVGGLLLAAMAMGWAASGPLQFVASGHTNYGDWSSNVTVSPAAFQPGAAVTVDATLKVSAEHLQNLAGAGIKADNFCLLVTAERTFDAAGHLHFPTGQYMSTLLTPTGLPIEGGAQGAVTNRFGGAADGPAPQRALAAQRRRRAPAGRDAIGAFGFPLGHALTVSELDFLPENDLGRC